jgi:hypothetical protein
MQFAIYENVVFYHFHCLEFFIFTFFVKICCYYLNFSNIFFYVLFHNNLFFNY